jgi:2,3-bisphosphoglycerate-dependent phosphoglycerate mutase
MTATYTLVLVRHGESEWNKTGLFTGWYDCDLSDAGRKEATDAGKALKEAGEESRHFFPFPWFR